MVVEIPRRASEERRVTLTAFPSCSAGSRPTLWGTGRLFLAHLSVHELPWMYLAMALVAALVTQTKARVLVRGRALPAILAVGAAGTLLLWAVGGRGPWALRALFVWTGLLGTFVFMAFWLLLGEIYTIAQARRLYAPIGLGSQLGAIAGAGVAHALSGALDTHHLLVASAVVFLAVALGPARILTTGVQALRSDTSVAALVTPGVLPVRPHTYLSRVAGLVLLATIAFTLGDYVFKSAVAEAVAPARLATFFASFTLTVAALSIVVQLFLSGALMRALGVSRALAVLPLLLLPTALGVAVGAGLAGALLLKTLDGALRPAINKVGIELLFVPVPEALRASAKTAIEVFGVRGGQALASVAILGVVAGGAGNKVIAGAAALTCMAWAGLALALQPHYLDLFRGAVREGALPDGAASRPRPELARGAVHRAQQRDDGRCWPRRDPRRPGSGPDRPSSCFTIPPGRWSPRPRPAG